ncbi:bacteriophage N4 adsorption protein B [Legionella gratiana]|uniref:Bacteriophage N4 adsorption protein B n=1 Tax=Legionella gratiana TaxID=45066 RepID=A0A378J432_9GAMM|nr:glycosyl transferase family protein [Legionella gratiana]KTD14626.1 bacteriophage N4 adsorption protein B [Legionella gratiana]STX41677.1 bacteriophage N4 adsorption protein B [Legionella gratiana]
MTITMILGIYYFAWIFLIIAAILFAISGIDDLFIDIYYWLRYGWRFWSTRKYPKLNYEMLKSNPEKNIAVLLPCWHEAGVIATMLIHNCNSIDYQCYDIFVGVYPNDPDTVNIVQEIEKINLHVHCVIGENPGPTNKASNLNQIYKYIKKYELTNDKHFDIYVFHDSEDIIHPLSFKLYNYLIPRKDMIQIPVFPLEVGYFKFTHWVYNDEFCENHTKDIVVRESIKGLVPSAGVGTAFSSHALKILAEGNDGQPFATYSLTEDYKTALTIRLKGLSQIFVYQSILHTSWKRKWGFWGKYVKVKTHEFIATRALFPMEYMKAVRQKARWIMGISLQEWTQTGWVGNISTRYTLLHDRKSAFTYFVNILGYALFIFWVLYWFVTHDNPQFPSLQEQFNLHPWVWYLVLFVTFLMLERLFQRFIATCRIYGWIPAFLSIPRILYANVINLHALLRAYRQFFFTPKRVSKSPVWDKTEHQFPGSHILISYKQRLGDLLVQSNLITLHQLELVVAEQKKTGEQIGDILRRKNYVNQYQLMKTIAQQYKLSLNTLGDLKPLIRRDMPGISFYNYYWLKRYNIYPIQFDRDKKKITVAIPDPSNEKLINEIINHLKPYQVQFELYV